MDMIFAQDTPSPDLFSWLPAKYVGPATSAMVVLTILGRVLTSLKNDPSFTGALKSVFMGSSTTTKALPNNSATVPVVAHPDTVVAGAQAVVLTTNTPVTQK